MALGIRNVGYQKPSVPEDTKGEFIIAEANQRRSTCAITEVKGRRSDELRPDLAVVNQTDTITEDT